MKKCQTCGEVKEMSEFPARKARECTRCRDHYQDQYSGNAIDRRHLEAEHAATHRFISSFDKIWRGEL